MTWVSLMFLLLCRPSSGRILEALHVDPASGVSLDKEKSAKVLKPSVRYLLVSNIQNPYFHAFVLSYSSG
jgi:hypothetical protein